MAESENNKSQFPTAKTPKKKKLIEKLDFEGML